MGDVSVLELFNCIFHNYYKHAKIHNFVLCAAVTDPVSYNNAVEEVKMYIIKGYALKDACKLVQKDRRSLYRFRAVHRLKYTRPYLYFEVSNNNNNENQIHLDCWNSVAVQRNNHNQLRHTHFFSDGERCY